MNAIKDELFVAKVEALGVSVKRLHRPSHLEVEPATNIEEELAKDVWDMRRFKQEYPKHRAPAEYPTRCATRVLSSWRMKKGEASPERSKADSKNGK
jgi:hypothetical protein